MELVSKIEELDQRITNNVSDLKLEDINLIKNTLSMDKKDPTLLELQGIVVEMIIFLKNSLLSFVDEEMVSLLFKLLVRENEATFENILRIFSKTKSERLEELLKSHLEASDKVDRVSINLSILSKSTINWKNNELRLLNAMENDLITLNVLKTYKGWIKKPCFEILYSKMSLEKPLKVSYKMFAEINEVLMHKNIDAMNYDIGYDEEYVGFIYSLMVDEETYTIAYEKLYSNGFFSSLFNALQSLVKLYSIEEKAILPEDIAYIEILLKIICKLVDRKYMSSLSEIRYKFFSFADTFTEVLRIKLPLNLKKLIYEILAHLSGGEEIGQKIQDFLNSGYIKKNAYIDFEYERLCDNFECSTKLLFLCLGLSYVPDLIEFALHVISSENPQIAVLALRIFKALSFKNIPGNIHRYLREACYKDKMVAQEVIDYSIELKCVIPNVELTKTVMAVESERFFDYVALFQDFSVYLNADFLGRLLDNKKQGLMYLRSCNEDVIRFVTMHREWFNGFVKGESDIEVQKLVLEMYSNMVSLSRFLEFSFSDDSKIILPELYCGFLFKIFSTCLLYCFYNDIDLKPYILEETKVHEEDLEEYCMYMKCKLVSELNVNIGFIVQNYTCRPVDDLVGFYRTCGKSIKFEPLSLKNRILEGKKDNNVFIKNYEACPKFEKYIMFNVVDLEDLERNYASKKEFERILKQEFDKFRVEGLSSKENVLIARNLLVIALLLDNIDPIIRTINDISVLPESLVDLAVSVSIKNLCNGGTSYVKSVLKRGKPEMQAKFLLILFFRNLWSSEMVIWAENLKKSCRNNENLSYLFDSLKS